MYIFQNRFSQANIDLNENLFETSALEFCSKKVSALNGDIRIALDACRKALEKFDITPANILTEKSNNAPKHFVKKVTMDELSQILPNKDINLTQYKCNLSINQKILLASLIKLIKGNNDNHDVLMNKAYKNYTIICGKKKLTKMSYLDFLTSCELLEDQKLLQITRLFNGLTKKIQIKGTVKDIEKGLQDQGLLSNIMQ
ncbi:cell division control protein 6 homolog [Gordionus sp. m RMFG-2023]|uniref:cell division control protein 6 homolog n=1 Tax=Gordionus sp. m RMFG-2023 TaxID=3053472 RepID=UPI0031FE4041